MDLNQMSFADLWNMLPWWQWLLGLVAVLLVTVLTGAVLNWVFSGKDATLKGWFWGGW